MSVPTYELSLDAADLKWLRSHVGTNRCFPGLLWTDHRQWPIWIGYRGRYSRWFRKPSFDISFTSDQPFAGQAKLHLNAAYRDPSLLRGRLSLDLFAEWNVPTPRGHHVWLTINGRHLGLYTALESLDRSWLQRRGHTTGTIYYGVNWDANFGLISPKTGRRKRTLALGYEKQYPFDNDFSDLERLLRDITLPDDDAFERAIDSALDVDTFLRWLIGVEFFSHTDGLIQNYALFRPDGGRWYISPWDCDGTWGRLFDGHRISAEYMSVGTGGDNYLAVRLLATGRWRLRYAELWEEALGGVLSRPRILDRLERMLDEIKPYALRDREKRRSNSTFLSEPAYLREYLAERTVIARAALLRLARRK